MTFISIGNSFILGFTLTGHQGIRLLRRIATPMWFTSHLEDT
jgi:hypothetical protein